MTAETTQDVRLAARGDRSAYGRLVRAYGPQMAATLSAYGVVSGDIEDVVQEAFVAAWRAMADYDADRPFKAWLFHIGLNKARDWRRRRHVRRFFFGAVALDGEEALGLEDPEPDPERETHTRRLLDRVRQAVDGLPDDLKRAFVLTTVSGMTYAESSAALGVSLKTVEGRLIRARRILQAKLSDIRESD